MLFILSLTILLIIKPNLILYILKSTTCHAIYPAFVSTRLEHAGKNYDYVNHMLVYAECCHRFHIG
jgi:hypothetical protein